MKANAPERIWIDPVLDLPKLSGHIDKNNIEYTRTDAFIEKACEWIKEKWDDNYTMPIIIDGVINDFKNYMKGK